MEKLGVDIEPADSKEAAERKIRPDKCPKCGITLLPWEDSNVPRCPNCGTEAFEAK